MTSSQKIKAIRSKLNLTQLAFAEKTGLTREVIANLETERSPLTALYVKVICDNLNVNREWLETETGEMLSETPQSFVDELAQKYGMDDFLKRIVLAYMDLTDDQRAVVREFILKITPPPPDDVEIFRAAHSSDDHAPEISTMSADEYKRLQNAPRTTSKNSDL